MHIPDGFLDLRTAAACGAVAVAGITAALRVARRTLPDSRVPLIGLTAACVFAAQMLNFPVAAGTSGHLVGATLATALVGPAAAVLVMTAVLTLQCLMFADGGVLALGANLLNMGLVAPCVAGAVLWLMRNVAGEHLRARLLAAAFAAWCSTVAAAVACALELSAAGIVGWRFVLPAMTGVHMLIGLVEALITAMVLAAVARSRPDMLRWHAPAGDSRRLQGKALLAGLVCVAGLVLATPLANSFPDGLQQVAEQLGFAARAGHGTAPMQGYGIGHVSSVALSTVLAALIGTVVAFGIAYVIARLLTPGQTLGRRGRA